MSEYEWPTSVTASRRHDVAIIMHVIAEHGPIENESGRATGMLLDLLAAEGVEIGGAALAKTLIDLEGGMFGRIITRKMNGKRTYSIALSRLCPELPPDPRVPAAEEDELDDDEGQIVDRADDEVEDIEEEFDGLVDLDEPIVGVALEAAPPPSKVDKLLYIVSMINEIINDEAGAPERDFMAQMNEQLTAVNAILDENRRLKEENDKLREDKRTLAATLHQANQVMRGRKVQATRNGQPEPVSV